MTLALLLSGLLGQLSATASTTALDGTKGRVPLVNFEVAVDEGHESDGLEERLARLEFRPTAGVLPNLGYDRRTLFARFRLVNRGGPADWVLQLGNPHLRDLRVLVRREAEWEPLFEGGVDVPLAQRPIRSRDFLIPLRLESGASSEVLVVTRSSQWLSLVPSLALPEVSDQQQRRETAFALFTLGGIVFVLLFNLFLFAATRDRTYLTYVLASVSVNLVVVPGCSGVLYLAFDESPHLAERIWHASTMFGSGFMALFVQSFLLRQPERARERVFMGWASRITFALSILSLIVGPQPTLSILLSALSGIFQVVVLVIAWRAAFRWGDAPARLFLAAWGTPLAAGVAFVLATQGAYPMTDGILGLLTVAATAGVVLMSLALGYRIVLLQKEKDANAARLALANQELRRQISDRSVQLFSALRLVDEPRRWDRSLAIGSEVNGRYRVERVLGEGAMGQVYEVSRLQDGTRWAMKVATETKRATLARFAREAHIASLVRHPRVVHIEDIDVAQSGFMYIVLELVSGGTLRDWALAHGGVATATEVRPLLSDVAEGLTVLHAQGIAHRDLKSGNVLLAVQNGRLRATLADFGISHVGATHQPTSLEVQDDATVELKPGGPQSATTSGVRERPNASATSTSGGARQVLDMTEHGVLTGTPNYAAPELASGLPVDELKADVFSFGVMAYQLLAGHLPFDPPAITFWAERRLPVVAPLPPAGAALESVVRRCLEFDPRARPDAAEIRALLEPEAATVEGPTSALG